MAGKSIRCVCCRRKLAEINDFKSGSIAIKCPRCGHLNTLRAATPSPPPPSPPPERP
ncbi:Com family DNA-binding transcriptional regulator [Roseospira visakhapatnamensis]|uniref:Com family DNA-binding transcriptional regulator n=1 Tax=Roseospira visakhapatnamensis TaxID=390880 RepID=UPI001C866C29